MQCRGSRPSQPTEGSRSVKDGRTLKQSQMRDVPSTLALEVEGLALEILRLNEEGSRFSARRLSDELLRRMAPALRVLARRFAKSRGTLGENDLVQVASIEVFKALGTYLPEKKGGQSFLSWSTWRARRALKEHVRLQAADVRPSDAAQRGRTRSRTVVAPVEVISRDRPEEALSGSVTESHDAALAMEFMTVEELLSTCEQVARLYYALADMEPVLRELVCRVHGLGRTRQSIRDVASEWGVPRWRLDALLARARSLLRRKLAERGS
ncbi:RNA polymerase sigma-70 factor [Myxococcus stipitatus DSM 14675]|uniref:RNA polymerase sigma-70 factor n=2 Tax=Myxococcus stipitatus TaxID=83455 RepID=L7U6R7_MYXSD|nr:RNA polymerase sigma-70 factor [Myxococcus stipitatus DSM 14675]